MYFKGVIMKKQHDLTRARFNQSANSGGMAGSQKRRGTLKHVLLFHVGVVVLLVFLVLGFYFLR